MPITLLGTGTCQLDGRVTSSVLLEWDDLRVVFDFGRGVAGALASRGLRQDDVRHIVLSHHHPDHVSDLIPYLHAAAWSNTDPRSQSLRIYGPPGTAAFLEGLIGAFPPSDLHREGYAIEIEEVGPSFTIGDHWFGSVSLPPAGNHGIRFLMDEKTIGLTGDSHCHADLIEFLRSCDLAVIDSGHLEDGEIVDVLARSGCPRVVASHLYRELDVEKLLKEAQKHGFSGVLTQGHCGQVLDVQ
jgi:ribonuclease BN (tRNA processing enzyme)